MFARVDDQQRLSLEVLVVQGFHGAFSNGAAHEKRFPVEQLVPCTYAMLTLGFRPTNVLPMLLQYARVPNSVAQHAMLPTKLLTRSVYGLRGQSAPSLAYRFR